MGNLVVKMRYIISSTYLHIIAYISLLAHLAISLLVMLF